MSARVQAVQGLDGDTVSLRPAWSSSSARSAAPTTLQRLSGMGAPDTDSWNEVPARNKVPGSSGARVKGGTVGSADGVYTVAIDDNTTKGSRTVQIPWGSDAGVTGPLRPHLERIRAELGSSAPPACKVNVYWLTVDHDIKSAVSEVIRPLLKLASQEECEMMWSLIKPQARLCIRKPHSCVTIRMLLARGKPEHKRLLISAMRGNVLRLANSTFAQHVLAKAFTVATLEEQQWLGAEIEANFDRILSNGNGAHMMQVALTHIPWNFLGQVTHNILENCEALAVDARWTHVLLALVENGGPDVQLEVLRRLTPMLMVLLQGNNSSQLLQMCLLCIAELPACKEKLQAVDAIVRQLLSHREEMETIMLSEAGAGIIEGVLKAAELAQAQPLLRLLHMLVDDVKQSRPRVKGLARIDAIVYAAANRRVSEVDEASRMQLAQGQAPFTPGISPPADRLPASEGQGSRNRKPSVVGPGAATAGAGDAGAASGMSARASKPSTALSGSDAPSWRRSAEDAGPADEDDAACDRGQKQKEWERVQIERLMRERDDMMQQQRKAADTEQQLEVQQEEQQQEAQQEQQLQGGDGQDDRHAEEQSQPQPEQQVPEGGSDTDEQVDDCSDLLAMLQTGGNAGGVLHASQPPPASQAATAQPPATVAAPALAHSTSVSDAQPSAAQAPAPAPLAAAPAPALAPAAANSSSTTTSGQQVLQPQIYQPRLLSVPGPVSAQTLAGTGLATQGMVAGFSLPVIAPQQQQQQQQQDAQAAMFAQWQQQQQQQQQMLLQYATFPSVPMVPVSQQQTASLQAQLSSSMQAQQPLMLQQLQLQQQQAMLQQAMLQQQNPGMGPVPLLMYPVPVPVVVTPLQQQQQQQQSQQVQQPSTQQQQQPSMQQPSMQQQMPGVMTHYAGLQSPLMPQMQHMPQMAAYNPQMQILQPGQMSMLGQPSNAMSGMWGGGMFAMPQSLSMGGASAAPTGPAGMFPQAVPVMNSATGNLASGGTSMPQAISANQQ